MEKMFVILSEAKNPVIFSLPYDGILRRVAPQNDREPYIVDNRTAGIFFLKGAWKSSIVYGKYAAL